MLIDDGIVFASKKRNLEIKYYRGGIEVMWKINTGLSAGNLTVYGSKSCPWTVKQLEYFDSNKIAYDFVDCSTNKCPEMITSFPTTVIQGFKEM